MIDLDIGDFPPPYLQKKRLVLGGLSFSASFAELVN